MKKIYTADKETGTFIEECKSIEEARELIAQYEEQDKINDVFSENFYDIVDDNHCTIEGDDTVHTFIVWTNSDSVPFKKRDEICQGITACAVDTDPEEEGKFKTLDEARAFIKKFESSVSYEKYNVGSGFRITESFIEEVELDEDGDIVDSFGYHDVTPLYALQKDDGDLYESRGIPKYYGNIESAKEAKRLIIESPSDDDEDISYLTIVELSGTPGRFTEVEEQ